jgi:hypothetical protein
MRKVCICGLHSEWGRPLCELLAEARRGTFISTEERALDIFASVVGALRLISC